MTPTETLALVDAARELVLVLIGIVEAGLVLVAAMVVAYLATCAWAALRS